MYWRSMNNRVFFNLLCCQFARPFASISICVGWISELSLVRYCHLCGLLIRLYLILFIFLNFFINFCLSQIDKIPLNNTTQYVDIRRSDSHRSKKSADFGICLNQVWVTSSNFPWDPGKLKFIISISQPNPRRLLGVKLGRWRGFLDLILLLKLMPGYDLLQEFRQKGYEGKHLLQIYHQSRVVLTPVFLVKVPSYLLNNYLLRIEYPFKGWEKIYNQNVRKSNRFVSNVLGFFILCCIGFNCGQSEIMSTEGHTSNQNTIGTGSDGISHILHKPEGNLSRDNIPNKPFSPPKAVEISAKDQISISTKDKGKGPIISDIKGTRGDFLKSTDHVSSPPGNYLKAFEGKAGYSGEQQMMFRNINVTDPQSFTAIMET